MAGALSRVGVGPAERGDRESLAPYTVPGFSGNDRTTGTLRMKGVRGRSPAAYKCTNTAMGESEGQMEHRSTFRTMSDDEDPHNF